MTPWNKMPTNILNRPKFRACSNRKNKSGKSLRIRKLELLEHIVVHISSYHGIIFTTSCRRGEISNAAFCDGSVFVCSCWCQQSTVPCLKNTMDGCWIHSATFNKTTFLDDKNSTVRPHCLAYAHWKYEKWLQREISSLPSEFLGIKCLGVRTIAMATTTLP